ncbi:unnamed protein product [Closterium sp. Naga37s-1]|nr:unnamed protein product [Closterium sp. Naga37s-1]
MVLGQVVYLSPDSTVEHAKLKSGTIIKVLPVKTVHEGLKSKVEVACKHGTNDAPAAAAVSTAGPLPAASAAASAALPSSAALTAALPAAPPFAPPAAPSAAPPAAPSAAPPAAPSAAPPAAPSAAPPAARTSTRIDYSKWDHLEASSDEEEEEDQEEEDEDEEEEVECILGPDLKSRGAAGSIGGGKAKNAETPLEKGSSMHEETAPKSQASSSAAAAKPSKAKGEPGAREEEEEEGIHRSAGAPKRPEQQGGVQVLDRADMVHYLDVRNGWDLAACEPCFDRVVSRRSKLALGIHSLRDLRSTLRRPLKESVRLVPPPANQASSPAQKAKARAIEEFSSGVAVPEGALGGTQGVQSSRERYKWKCERAPGICAEAMVLEWMAEPRVGVMMDLGMIRSRLPGILGAHMDSDSATFPGVMRELGVGRQEKEDGLASLLVQVLGVKDAGELKEGFGFFMQNLLSGGVRERGEGERREARAGGAGGGAGRGVGEQAGGEGWRMFEEMMGMMRMMGASNAPTAADVMTRMRHVMGVDGEEQGGGTVVCLVDEREGGGRGGRRGESAGRKVGKDGKWREHLKGPVWERYVDGMAWILEHGGGEGREFRCSHCSENGSSSNSSCSGSPSLDSPMGCHAPKGMHLSGVGATEFALACATVLSNSGQRKQGEVFCMDAESASKARVEDAAVEKAKEWLSRDIVAQARMKWETEMGQVASLSDIIASDPNGAEIAAADAYSASLTDPPAPSPLPVNNTNPIVSAMTYRVGCILQWVRIYGSDFISARRCFKGSPHGKTLPMRHPLRDLPSLLVRLGAIPKPLPWKQFDSEWEEWPRGEEDAVKLPADQCVRCFRLGIVEEAAAGDNENKGSGTGSGGKRGKGRGRGISGKEGGGAHPSRGATTPRNRPMPIVRCAADAHFLVEFAGHQVYPPACARCRSCLGQFTYHIFFLTLLANFAYRPATVLLNRFLSVFPPRSPEFCKLVDLLLLEPFPRGTCAAFQVQVVRERAEEIPVYFLLNVALYWPNAMLQVEEIGMVGRDEWKGELLGGEGRKAAGRTRGGGAGGRGEEEEEDDGEVWEEVKDWGFAVLIAWRTDAMTDLIDDCRRGSSGGPPRKCSKDVATELCNRSLESRFCEEWDHGVPPASSSNTFYSSGSSSSSSSSSRSKEGKGKKEEEEEVPAHLKAWPGGGGLPARDAAGGALLPPCPCCCPKHCCCCTRICCSNLCCFCTKFHCCKCTSRQCSTWGFQEACVRCCRVWHGGGRWCEAEELLWVWQGGVLQ